MCENSVYTLYRVKRVKRIYTYATYTLHSVDFRLLIGLFYCTTLKCLLREAIDISTYIERACTSALFYNNYTNNLRQIFVRFCSGKKQSQSDDKADVEREDRNIRSRES